MNEPEYKVPPTEPEAKQNWFSSHMILGIVFLVVVLAAIVAGIYYWQTVRVIPSSVQAPIHKDETANWKTYTNDKYGFEIKYPSDWRADIPPKSLNELTFHSESSDISDPAPFDESIMPDEIYFIFDQPPFTGSWEIKKINGIDWRTFFSEVSGWHYEVNHLGKNYSFQIPGDTVRKPELELFLSTFKFTDHVSPTVQTHGTIAGHVNIGPVCPVEQVDNPCKPTAQMYTSEKITVYASDAKTIVVQKNLDEQGNYSIELNPGNYTVTVSPAGMSKEISNNVTIVKSQTTTLNFDIDTGIR